MPMVKEQSSKINKYKKVQNSGEQHFALYNSDSS